MYNIWQIFKDDLRMLSKNAISIVVVIGLICLPSVYAWFNIAGCWDPYKNTSELKIAFVNNDMGYSSEYFPIDINIGNTTTAMITKNDSFQWSFDDYDSAIAGVSDGTYYAAIVVPEDFSKQIMSILSENKEQATLIYYQNDKLSAIAPKLTTAGANAIQQKVNTQFNQTLMTAVLKTTLDLTNALKSDSFTNLANKAASAFGEASTSLNSITAQLESTKSLLNSVQKVMDSLNNIMPSEEGNTTAHLHETINKIENDLREAIAELNNMINTLANDGVTTDALQQLKGAAEDLLPVCESAHNVCNDLVNVSESLKNSNESLNQLISDATTKIDRICHDLNIISSDMKNTQEFILKIVNNDSVDKIQQIIGTDAKEFATLLSAPVQLERTAVWPVKNIGSSMAAFYTSLGIWVGCTLLVAMMETDIDKNRLQNMKKKGPIKDRHLYFGRYLIFALISLLQTTLVCLGNIFFLQIQCVHPVLFFIVGYLCSLLFSLLIYTLVISFKNIGKAIALILLVLQVTAAGGVFPYEMINDAFKIFYPFLPFTYTIDAFHCAIAGYSMWQIWLNMGFLILTLVPLILLLGLILRKPLIKGNKWIKKQTAKTHMM